jgi:hypothetical protein
MTVRLPPIPGHARTGLSAPTISARPCTLVRAGPGWPATRPPTPEHAELDIAGALNPARPTLAPKSRYEHGREGSDGRARARGDAGHRAEATHPTDADEADRPRSIAGGTCADVAHVAVESHSDPRVAQSPLRVVIEANAGCVHHPCVESQSAQDLGQRTVVPGAEPSPSPERGLRLLPDMQHRIRREPVVHEPRGLVNKVPSGGPASPAHGHSIGQAALRHGSIVLRLPGPMKAHAHRHNMHVR